jgi:hypothetical protein
MRYSKLLAIACLFVFGCGRSATVVAQPKLADFLTELEATLGDTRGQAESLKSEIAASQARSAEGDGNAAQPAQDMIGSLQAVVSAAEQFAHSAAGHPAESDAKAILADATSLLKKSQPTPNADEVVRGLEQLSSKVQSIKGKL